MAYPFILYSNIDDTPTATSGATGYDIENAFDLRTYVRWKATSTSDQNIDFDAGTAVDVDALGISGHNLGSASASVVVKSSATGAFAGEETTRLASFDPSDDTPIVKPFTSASARYWRITLSGLSVAPQIGVLMLGERMDFGLYPDSPLNYKSSEMMASDQISKGGHLLGVSTRYEPYTFSMTFSYVLLSWVQSNLDTWWNYAKHHKPFFVSINSDSFTDGRFCRVPSSYKYDRRLTYNDYIDSISLSFEGIE